MIDFKAGLYSYLSTRPTLTALIGTRIYPTIAPATAAMPYITYQRIDEQEEGHLRGLSGLRRAIYQFDVWGATHGTSEAALLALQAALDRYRGTMGSVVVEDVYITSILDGLEEPEEGQTMGDWRHTVTADIWFRDV